MTTIVKRNKALSVNPLKTSQPLGASLAILGLQGAMPLMHGSQGCTAFAKVMFVRHFREPIPLQTTAMDQVATVMGADGNVVEALRTICEKQKPAVIGLMTTGLSETQGTDIQRAVKEFRAEYPQFEQTRIVAVNTPDFSGSFESGFALAVEGIVKSLVPNREDAGTEPGRRQRQVNVLVGAALTPGDLEALRDLFEWFELRPVVIPDTGDSLDGHLTSNDFNPLTVGGTSVSEIESAGDSLATVVIGRSLGRAADALHERTGVPDYRFDSLMGLEPMDEFIHLLSRIAERPVPERIERQRAQLQDAMVDTHFMLGFSKVALAADPDQLLGFTRLLQGMGAEVVTAVTPARGPALESLPLEEVKVGDLEDLELGARAAGAELVMGNSHAAQAAERLGRPLLRIGFPQYDLLGGYQRTWIGYRGTRQALFDLANTLLEHGAHSIEPHRSIYAQKPEYRLEESDYGHAEATAASRNG